MIFLRTAIAPLGRSIIVRGIQHACQVDKIPLPTAVTCCSLNSSHLTANVSQSRLAVAAGTASAKLVIAVDVCRRPIVTGSRGTTLGILEDRKHEIYKMNLERACEELWNVL